MLGNVGGEGMFETDCHIEKGSARCQLIDYRFILQAFMNAVYIQLGLILMIYTSNCFLGVILRQKLTEKLCFL